MFTKLFRRLSQRNHTGLSEQRRLDILRYTNADNQLMQLHCDRMQSALKSR